MSRATLAKTEAEIVRLKKQLQRERDPRRAHSFKMRIETLKDSCRWYRQQLKNQKP
jgi:hypothetical protein